MLSDTMTDKSVWNQPVSVPVETIQYVDEGVRESENCRPTPNEVVHPH